jgi:Cu/Zn superoxide dismutase
MAAPVAASEESRGVRLPVVHAGQDGRIRADLLSDQFSMTDVTRGKALVVLPRSPDVTTGTMTGSGAMTGGGMPVACAVIESVDI